MRRRTATVLFAMFLLACGGTVEPEPASDDEEVVIINTEPDPQEKEDDSADELADTPRSLADVECPEESPLTWDNFGGAFMRDWCTGCHSSELPKGARADAPMGVDLETQRMVLDWSERVWARSAGDDATMPPYGGPSEEERRQLEEWLACGAP